MMCCMCRGLLEKLVILFALMLAGSVNTIGVKADSGDYFPYDDEDGCTEDEYLCNVSRICIPEIWLCDSDNDCGYWEDELESMCAICPNGCYNGGTCRHSGICTCTVGWSGSSCTIPLCPAGCLNGGNCSSPGICTCPTGWAGNDCRQDVDESDDSFSTEATIAISVVVVIIILIVTTMIIITSLYYKYQRELKKKYEVDNSNINESVNTKQKDLCGVSITMVHRETVTDTNGPTTTVVEADTNLGYRIAAAVNKVETDSNYEIMSITDETDTDPASGSHTINAMHTRIAPKAADAMDSKKDIDPVCAHGTVMHPANKMHTNSIYIAAATSACLHNC